MYCTNCGNKLDDHADFCPYCGRKMNVPQQAAAAEPVQKQPSGKGSRRKLWIGICICAAVIIAVSAAVFALVSTPAVKVSKAIRNTEKHIHKLSDNEIYEAVSKFSNLEACNQDFTMKVNRFESKSTPLFQEGISYRISTAGSRADRVFQAQIVPQLSGAELFAINLSAEDEMLYLACPGILPDNFYGINTETLGADLEKFTGDVGELSQLHLNLFDFADLKQQYSDRSKEISLKLQEEAKTILKEISVKSIGKITYESRSGEVTQSGYSVTIPKEALQTFLRTAADAQAEVSSFAYLKDFMRTAGFPEEAIEDLLSEIRTDEIGLSKEQAFLKSLADNAEDTTFEVCLNKGYLSRVEFTQTFQGETAETEILLDCTQSGKLYLDMSVTVDDHEISKISMEHAKEGGVYSDNLSFTVNDTYENNDAGFHMELSWEHDSMKDNLALRLELPDDLTIAAEGQLELSEEYPQLHLSDLSIINPYGNICSLSVDYSAAPYEKILDTQNAYLIKDLTPMDIQKILQNYLVNISDLSDRLSIAED